jgi:hypothetical protein
MSNGMMDEEYDNEDRLAGRLHGEDDGSDVALSMKR